MRIYHIEFSGYFESDKHVYIMAEDFDEAVKIAQKLGKIREEKGAQSGIIKGISEEFELTTVNDEEEGKKD